MATGLENLKVYKLAVKLELLKRTNSYISFLRKQKLSN